MLVHILHFGGTHRSAEDGHVVNGTDYWVGNHWNPLQFYEIKDVDEFELMAQYGLQKDRNGQYEKPDVTTMMSQPSPCRRAIWRTSSTVLAGL